MTIREEKIEQWNAQKARDRWIVLVVFVFSLLITLVFWWIGGLKNELSFDWGRDPEVWRRIDLENKGQKFDTSALENEIRKSVKNLTGDYVIYAKGLDGNTTWQVAVGEVDDPISMGGLINLPVMIGVVKLAEEKNYDLQNVFVLKNEGKVLDFGGLSDEHQAESEVKWIDVLRSMGKQSDPNVLQATIDYWGEEALQKKFIKMGWLKTSFESNKTTAWEISRMFEGLYEGRWVGKSYAKKLLVSMVNTDNDSYLPAGVPFDVMVSHKATISRRVISDAGIVYGQSPYVLVMMSVRANENEVSKVFPEISKIVWEWSSKLGV